MSSNLMSSYFSSVYSKEPLDKLFYEKVGYKIEEYGENFQQYGIRENQTYAEHVLGGCSLILSIKDAINLTETETKVLLSAFAIHDLNKIFSFDTGSKKSVLSLADNSDYVKEQIKRFGIDDFFSEWADYFYDIVSLIRQHSIVNTGFGTHLFPVLQLNKLEKDRLEKLIHVIRAVDNIDLSKTLDEIPKKELFVSEINSVSDKKYIGLLQNVGENKDIITQIIISAWEGVLLDNGGFIVYYYQRGQFCLFPADKYEELKFDLKKLITNKMIQIINDMKKKNFANVIEIGNGNKWINIADEIYGIASLDLVWEILKKKAIPREMKPDPLKKFCSSLKINYNDFLKNEGISPIPPIECYIFANLITATKSFFNKLNEKKVCEEFISELIPDLGDLKKMPLPTIIEKHNLYTEDNLQKIKELWLKYWNPKDNTNDWEKYINITCQITPLFPEKQDISGFKEYMTSYLKEAKSKDSSGAFFGKTELMTEIDVPKDISVQQFSNRLVGGKIAGPVRYFSFISKQQYFLTKLSYKKITFKDTIYIHLVPTKPISYKNMIIYKEIMLSLSKIKEFTMGEDLLEEEQKETSFWRTAFNITSNKAYNPLSVSNFGSYNGYITIMNNAGDIKTVEKIIHSIKYAYRLAKTFHFNAVISRLAILPFAPESNKLLTIDFACGALQKLLYKRSWNEEEAKDLFEIILAVDFIKTEVGGFSLDTKATRFEYALLTSVEKSVIKFISIIMKKLYSNKSNNDLSIQTILKINPEVQKIIQWRENQMPLPIANPTELLVKYAITNNIKGKGYAANAFLKPLSIACDCIKKPSLIMFDNVALKGVIESNIQSAFKRIDERYGKNKNEYIHEWTEMFFDIYLTFFKGNRKEFLYSQNDFKKLYLYFTDQITKQQIFNQKHKI